MSISSYSDPRIPAFKLAEAVEEEANAHEWSQIDHLENVQNLASLIIRLAWVVSGMAAELDSMREEKA